MLKGHQQLLFDEQPALYRTEAQQISIFDSLTVSPGKLHPIDGCPIGSTTVGQLDTVSITPDQGRVKIGDGWITDHDPVGNVTPDPDRFATLLKLCFVPTTAPLFNENDSGGEASTGRISTGISKRWPDLEVSGEGITGDVDAERSSHQITAIVGILEEARRELPLELLTPNLPEGGPGLITVPKLDLVWGSETFPLLSQAPLDRLLDPRQQCRRVELRLAIPAQGDVEAPTKPVKETTKELLQKFEMG